MMAAQARRLHKLKMTVMVCMCCSIIYFSIVFIGQQFELSRQPQSHVIPIQPYQLQGLGNSTSGLIDGNGMGANKLQFVPAGIKDQGKTGTGKIMEVTEEVHQVGFGAVSKAKTFEDALSAAASKDNVVLLTLVDLAFHAMAVNYYLTCLKPFNITNYIILTMHPDTCKVLNKHDINCFFYKDMSKGNMPSKWGTQIFKDKMNVRTDFVLKALQANYSVLHSDIDMFCMKNVMKETVCPRGKCDIAPLYDSSAYNAGYLWINPCPASIAVYQHMKELAKSSPGMDDQAQLNRAMNRQKGIKTAALQIKVLSKQAFLCGVNYYEYPKRYFADTAKPCPQCVVVHNNWIVSMVGKVYRAKEMHHWMYDGKEAAGADVKSAGYYTSTTARYLRYNKVIGAPRDSLISALAIAQALNRTLILPKFPCGSGGANLCPLNSLFRVTAFDGAFIFREHSFSTHPRVPEAVKTSVSPLYGVTKDDNATDSKLVVIRAKNPDKGMDDEEIVQHFGLAQQSILQFNSLNGLAFSHFTNAETENLWQKKIKDGLQGGQYRQYNA